VLFLGAQRGEGLLEPGDFPKPGPRAGFADALGEVVFEFAQQRQAAGFGVHRAAQARVLVDARRLVGAVAVAVDTPQAIAIRLPTPMASDSSAERGAQLGGQRPSGAKRQTGLPEVIDCHLAGLHPGNVGGRPQTGRERLLPTPDTGTSPNGHQSGRDLDAAARTLTTRAGSATPIAWAAYEPAIRRWEHVLRQPAPTPGRARPRRDGRGWPRSSPSG
jgi:hypothetical protein